ncbi:MAG TPA: GspH/FimT family protein [Thermoanaerobaculia bacterium]|nr:GspH/FimT family protein [Thermoanaerobaculia bacterium]
MTKSRGFTLVELLVTVAVAVLALLLLVPALQSIFERRRLQGTAEQALAYLRQARYEAIQRNRAVAVTVDEVAGVLFRDLDGDGSLDPAERQEGTIALPEGVELGGPPADADPVVGFTESDGRHSAVFLPTGTLADDGGAFRLRDADGNWLEVRILDRRTAIAELRKWDGTAWRRQDEGGRRWNWES